MLRELLCAYRGAAHDLELLEPLGALVGNAVRANAAALRSDVQRRRWLLQRLVDLSVQSGSSSSTSSPLFALVAELADASDELRQYVLSGKMVVVAQSHCTAMLFSAMEKRSLAEIARAHITTARGPHHPPGSGTGISAGALAQSNALMDLLVRFLRAASSGFAAAFVLQVLSLPLLQEVVAPERLLQLAELPVWEALVNVAKTLSLSELPPAPVVGISSSTWLLGNVLWISERVSSKTSSLVLSEVQLFTKLLQAVPAETFAANGVAVSWTKVSESHSVPVVFPEALNDQLQILLRDRFVRAIADKLLWLNAGSLRSPLSTARPVPMFPAAPSLAVRSGTHSAVDGSSGEGG